MSLQDSYGGSASNAEIDPKGGYWINTTKGRQHFPGTPPGATKPLPIPQPVSDFLTKASNVLEAPLTGIGATEMDLLRPPYLKVGLGPSGQHMLDELRHGQFGSAAQHYSTTSLEANKERAQLGDPGAQFLEKHPGMLFAPLAFGEEFFNPSNRLFSAAGSVGRAVGLKPLSPLNRFADVRGAAAEAPAQRAAAAESAVQREARMNAVRQGAAAERARARAAAHFAQKQRESLKNQGLRAGTPQTPPTLGTPPVRRALPEPGAEFRPNPPQPAPGYVPPALRPGALPITGTPAVQHPALTGEARLALPPGGTVEGRLQQSLRDTLKSIRRQTRARPPSKPIAQGPLTPPSTIGGRPALPAPQTIEGPNIASGEGFEMNAAPGIPGRPALTGANPVPEFENLVPPGRLTGEIQGALPAGEKGITTPGSQLSTRYGTGEAITPVGEVQPLGPKPELPAKEVADRAELTFRKMAETQSARAAAGEAVHNLYKGLTRSQQVKLFDAIEGTEPMPPEFAKRAAAYTAVQRRLSKDLLEHGVADESELWNEETYHPRSGASLNPEFDLQEQRLEGQGAGSRGVRKGTLIHERDYPTRKAMELAGEQMNPEWAPAETLENTLRSRYQSIQLEKGMRELQDLGLILPAEKPRPPGWVTLAEEPDVARFGSPTIANGASFHPAIAKGIRDITASTMNPDKFLSSPLHKIAEPLAMANRAVSRFEVTNPGYHPIVNVGPNQIATIIANAKSIAALPTYVKNLFDLSSKGLDELSEEGVYHPFASDIPAHEMTRPWSDLSLPEKMRRLWNLSGRGVENVSAKPLYKHIEPRMARATYNALKRGGKTDAEAALLTRQTVGEAENLGAVERDAAQMMQFPAWRKAVARLWPNLLAKSPALYNAPHRAVNAYNLAHGMTPQPYSGERLVPPIAFGKDANGNPQTLTFPSPANIPLEVLDLIGAPLAGDSSEIPARSLRLGMTLVNPLLNTGVRTAMTQAGKSGEPGTGLAGYRLYDKDAPINQGPLGIGLSSAQGALQRYSPIRPGALGPLGGVGVSVQPVMGNQTQQDISTMEARYRKLIDRLRYQAVDDLKAGDAKSAAQDTQDADDLWREMEQVVQQMSTPSGAVPAAAAGDTLQSRYGSSPAVSPAP